MLEQTVAHLGTGGLGERGELTQRLLGLRLRGLRARPYADEHDAFEPHLAVFDLGDVLQLAQSGDVLELVARLAFHPLLVVAFRRFGDTPLVEEHFGRLGEHSPATHHDVLLVDAVPV